MTETEPAKTTAPDLPANEAPCPCGSALQFGECCQPFLAGAARPDTALSLMRSRYAAYSLRQGGYLLDTWHPATRPARLDLSTDETAWLGLDILRHESGGAGDREGLVEFAAAYRQGGTVNRFRESSRFVREAGAWFYLDGKVMALPAPGRNEPCPCGSGKKYKKCCG